jgi:hypothetical protein
LIGRVISIFHFFLKMSDQELEQFFQAALAAASAHPPSANDTLRHGTPHVTHARSLPKLNPGIALNDTLYLKTDEGVARLNASVLPLQPEAMLHAPLVQMDAPRPTKKQRQEALVIPHD